MQRLTGTGLGTPKKTRARNIRRAPSVTPPTYKWHWNSNLMSTTTYGGYLVIVSPATESYRREFWFRTIREAKKQHKLIKESNNDGYIHAEIFTLIDHEPYITYKSM